MKYALSLCAVLMLPMLACGQQIAPAVGSGPQVVLRPQIFEVSLTKLQQLGLSLEKVTGKPDTGLNGAVASSGSRVVSDDSEALQVLEKLRQNNVATVLAQPTLSTFDGVPVVFYSGEQVLVPKPQPDGSVAMEGRQSTMLELTPEVRDERINLLLHVRLLEVDHKHPVRIGQQTLPGVLVREVETGGEFSNGETLVVVGPTRSRMEAYRRKVPYLGEIPYIGTLFGKVEEEENKLMLLILVRAEIRAPAAASRPAFFGPQDSVPTRR